MFRLSLNSTRGFTLLEMALVMAIIGIIMIAMIPLLDHYNKRKAANETTEKVAEITAAIGNFRTLHGRYPAPASSNLTRASKDYGRELRTDYSAILPGNCVNGICIQESTRSFTYEDPFTKAPVTGKPRVRIGSVPFRSLNLEEDQVYDGYHHRIMYAVTEHLAFSDSFAADQGGIEILGDEDAGGTSYSVIEPPGSAHFIIYSFGENEFGAYNRAGIRLPCPADTHETANCDNGSDAVFRNSLRSDDNNDKRFDDIVSYFTQDQIPLWQLSQIDSLDIHQKPSGEVGINVEASHDVAEEGDIDGAIRAIDDPATTGPDASSIEGKVMSSQICDIDGGNCFPSDLIAGNRDRDNGGLVCDAGEFMTGISTGKPSCTKEIIIDCNGKFITGIDASGRVICHTENCSAANLTLCGHEAEIPEGTQGVTKIINFGPNVTKTFLCDGGSWTQTASTGECECTPETQTKYNGCGAGYTGRRLQERTMKCPEGKWTGWVTLNDSECKCVGGPQERKQNCPANQTGSILQQRTLSCETGKWTAWKEISNTCKCEAKTQTRNVSCPDGLTGKITEERALSCPSGKFSAWKETANNCRCEPKTQNATKACGTGKIGTIKRTRTLQCPSGKWSPWTEDASACEDAPKVACRWASSGSGISSDVSMGPRISSSCECGTSTPRCYTSQSGSSYRIYSPCSCK